MHKIIRITTVPVSLLILLRSQLKFMSDYYEVIAVSSKGEILEQVEEQAGVRTIGVDMTRKITPFKDLKALWNLYCLLKKEKPLMVHTHTPKAGLLGMIAAQMAGVPIRLHTVAGMPLLETNGVKRKILELAEKLTYICATKVYPNSFKMKELIIENNYCSSDKLKVIGNGSSNGIDTKYFDPGQFNEERLNDVRASLNIENDTIVYCFVGRIVADKGIHELIKAFLAINAKLKNVKLLLVGTLEPDLDPLDEFTLHQINNNSNIIWVGFQKDVRPYLAISNIFVFPSYREGFPNVVMQAGAMGLSCIVSNINGCNEIIRDGFNGIIIPFKDEYNLQRAMEKLALDSGCRNFMASNSRQLIISRYDQQYVLNELLNEYNTLCVKYN